MSADAETESLLAHEELADSPAKGTGGPSPASEGPAVATARDRLDHSLQVPATLSNQQGAQPGRLLASDEPQYITVQERKLQVGNAEEEPLTLYTLCRRWVQNDPEACVTATVAKQQQDEFRDTGVKREPLEPIDESSIPPLPGAEGSLREVAPVEDLRKELRDRALAVRSHFRAKQQAKAKACVRRIAKLLAASAASAAPTSTHPAEPG